MSYEEWRASPKGKEFLQNMKPFFLIAGFIGSWISIANIFFIFLGLGTAYKVASKGIGASAGQSV